MTPKCLRKWRYNTDEKQTTQQQLAFEWNKKVRNECIRIRKDETEYIERIILDERN